MFADVPSPPADGEAGRGHVGGLDPKPHRRVGRDIVLRQPAKFVGLGKGFNGFLGQHAVAVDQYDARLELLVAGKPGWLFGRRFEGFRQGDFFDFSMSISKGDYYFTWHCYSRSAMCGWMLKVLLSDRTSLGSL